MSYSERLWQVMAAQEGRKYVFVFNRSFSEIRLSLELPLITFLFVNRFSKLFFPEIGNKIWVPEWYCAHAHYFWFRLWPPGIIRGAKTQFGGLLAKSVRLKHLKFWILRIQKLGSSVNARFALLRRKNMFSSSCFITVSLACRNHGNVCVTFRVFPAITGELLELPSKALSNDAAYRWKKWYAKFKQHHRKGLRDNWG